LKYPRRIAVRVLTRVLSDFETLDEALAQFSSELSSPEVAWLQEVCSGALRWKGRLDFLIDSVADRKKPSGWLRKILLLSAYQLVVQDRVSVGAVVSETVDEVKQRDGVAPSRFANACLRKIAAQGKAWRDLEFPTPSDPLSAQAIAWSGLPSWIWTRLVRDYGLEWARAYAQASLERPKLWIRSRYPNWEVSWVGSGPIPCSWQALEGGAIAEKDGFKEGEFFVQDITSQVLVHEVSEELKKYDFQGRAIQGLDLCAAPGGKAVGMAWSGVDMTATDISSSRLSLLTQTVQRTQADVKVIAWSELQSLSPRDFVWVDAPCTGSGILRRHPDVRWLKGEKELSSLLMEQSQALKQGLSLVHSGGFLLYSVCSVLSEEGLGQIQKAGLEAYVLKKWVLAPHLGYGGDGFSAFLLRKP
jgi:16S rRNA (cytosine967-C5)-methyltransferase